MADSITMIITLTVAIFIMFLARKFRRSQTEKAGRQILNELRSKGAVEVASAIDLPYARRSFLRVGLRDDRPKILKQFIQLGIVCISEDGLFYLDESKIPV